MINTIFLKLIARTISCSLLFFFSIAVHAQTFDPAAKVNPFIGTGGHGHTYPGSSMPFGMMQLSPDTRLEGWDGCSGYHYSDSLIYGFSHTHLSGTGIPDYCDVLLMPFTGDVQWVNKDYASAFSHSTEKASPGFYEVLLEKHNIKASLTTTTRAGMHRYQFPQDAGSGKVLIDLQHRDEVLESSIEIVNDHTIKGMRRSKSWATNQVVYFYMEFDRPFSGYSIALNNMTQSGMDKATGKNIKAWVGFNLDGNRTAKVKVGISGVSEANAKENMLAEIPDWDFEGVKQAAHAAWNKELSKIEVKGGTNDEQTIFYTALYHASLSPNVYTDVNGDYRGTDLKVHQAKDFTNYTVFSLWDTYRALHPLQAIINRRRTSDWINTFLAQYKFGGMLPVWELSANETFCMIGYHSVPVIADAMQKGIEGFDKQLALKAMIDYAESDRFGLKAYREKGFIANNDDHESASKTMEYAYDDWCIAQVAKQLGQQDSYRRYMLRAQQYKNLFDPATKHIRGKVQAFWYQPFKATEVNDFFTEGNSWHYSFAAPQDVSGMIKLYGGPRSFAGKLNEMFTTTEDLSGREQADVTGLIGQYAHGNEPSHHMAYLFNYAGQPWRTQELVSQVCKSFYKNEPDGLIGNEDCGQMSAWYIFSAMGFYPVTPASGQYALGTPVFDEINIHLENGKTFTISAKNLSANNKYVGSMQLNGKNLPATFINHAAIANGGSLVFNMVDQPDKTRGTRPQDMPATNINANDFVAVPYFDMESNKIKDSLRVVMGSIDKDAKIYYYINGKVEPLTNFAVYKQPVILIDATSISFYAEKGGYKSPVVTQQFYKVVTDRSISVKSEVHPMYTAGGADALIDGIEGTVNWKTGEWQSYFAKDFEAVVAFKQPTNIKHVGIHVLQDVSPWIIFPKEVMFEVSDDGINYKPLVTVANKIPNDDKQVMVQELGADVNTTARFVRIKAVNGDGLPPWHESAGQPSHLFIDEVIIK